MGRLSRRFSEPENLGGFGKIFVVQDAKSRPEFRDWKQRGKKVAHHRLLGICVPDKGGYPGILENGLKEDNLA
jgi:hypothetical protein